MSRLAFQKSKNVDARAVTFRWEDDGLTVEVEGDMREDGTMLGASYYVTDGKTRKLMFSTERQIGTMADAVAEFMALQESITPDEVYQADPDRLGVGTDGPIEDNAREQVRRMNAADPTATNTIGRMVFRAATAPGQEYGL